MWYGCRLGERRSVRDTYINYKLLGTIISGIVIFLVMSLRNNQGLDYVQTYVNKWYQYRMGVKSGLETEVIISGIMWLLGKTTQNPQWIMVVLSALVVVPLWTAFYQVSDIPWLSVLLFPLTHHFFMAMAAFDLEIGLSLIAVSLIFLKKNKIVPYILCVCIAGLCYTPLFLFIPLYYLKNKEINALLAISIITIISVIIRIYLIETEAYDDIGYYIAVYLPLYDSWLLFENLFLGAVVIVLSAEIAENGMNNIRNYYLNMNFICLLIVLNASLFNVPENRFMMLNYCQIFSLPLLVSQIKSKREQVFVIIGLTLVMSYVLYNKVYLGNVYNPLPYVFFFR